jgi:hypothetical protein
VIPDVGANDNYRRTVHSENQLTPLFLKGHVSWFSPKWGKLDVYLKKDCVLIKTRVTRHGILSCVCVKCVKRYDVAVTVRFYTPIYHEKRTTQRILIKCRILQFSLKFVDLI